MLQLCGCSFARGLVGLGVPGILSSMGVLLCVFLFGLVQRTLVVFGVFFYFGVFCFGSSHCLVRWALNPNYRKKKDYFEINTCILINRSELGLMENRFFVNSWRSLSTSARSCGVPAFGSNSQCWRPMKLFVEISLSPPSAIFSFHILSYPSFLSFFFFLRLATINSIFNWHKHI